MAKAQNRAHTQIAEPGTIPAGFDPIGFEIWRPDPGETLQGHYLRKLEVASPSPTKEKPTFTAFHIRGSAGKHVGTTVTVSGAYLNNLFMDMPRGTEVFLRFIGEEEKNGKRTKIFEVSKSKAAPINIDDLPF